MDEQTEKQIKATLDKIRPFLQRDGGDVEYVGFKDGIVYVKMTGACEGCVLASQDITAGVEIILIEEVPGVVQVKMDDIPVDVIEEYQKRKAKELDQNEKNLKQ